MSISSRPGQLSRPRPSTKHTDALAARQVGESCFEEGLYEAARVIFTRMPSWGRLASTLVRLHQFQAAVDAARKANSPKTWKEVLPHQTTCPLQHL